MKSKIHIIGALINISAMFLCFTFFILGSTQAGEFKSTMPTVVDPRYEISILVPGSHFHGIHGMTFDSQDNLYAGSVAGQTTYCVDPNTGKVKEYIGPPLGMADDLEFGPDGRLYWTTMLMGKLYCKSADGKVIELAEGLPGINSLAFNQEGRLFATQVFLGDALWEIDLSGKKKNRKIAEKLGGLNGFDFGPDNMLYGPLWFKGVIARVDVETGQVEVVAKGFKTPAAVNFDSKGNLYVVDTAAGEVVRVDVNSGQKALVAKIDPAIDNLAIDSKDRLFITNMANNGIYEINTKTGKARTVVEGKLSCAQGVAVTTGADGDTLYLTDLFSYRKVDGFTGEVTTVTRMHTAGSHLEYPFTVSVKDKSVILTSWFTGTVQEIDRLTNHSKRMLHGFKAPSHALMMDEGSFIVAEIATGNLLKVTGEEGKDRVVIAKGLIVPTYLAPAGPDAVYVTEAMAGTVARIDLKSGEKKVVASGLKMPEGVSVHPDGKLVVVETGTRQLVEIDPVSGAITPLVINLAVGFPSYPGGPPPHFITGVAVSESGTIYVTGDLENVVYKISPK